MSESEFGVMLFYSTNWAIRAERVAKKAGFEVKLIPTPRHLSSDCGTALRFRWPDRDALATLLEEHKVVLEKVAQL